MSPTLQERIDDARVEGWELESQDGDRRAVMVKRSYGRFGAHVLIALLSAWWSLGLVNAIYAAYVYFGKADKRVIRVDEPREPTTTTPTTTAEREPVHRPSSDGASAAEETTARSTDGETASEAAE